MITSLDNPRVREVVRLRKARERRREGVLLAEGVREVERALAAGLVLRQVFHAPELLPGWELPDLSRSRLPSLNRSELPDRGEGGGLGSEARGQGEERGSVGREAGGVCDAPEEHAHVRRDEATLHGEEASVPRGRDAMSVRREEVSARVLAKMSYRDEPEGVLAVFETPDRTVPADATLLVVAVGIEKPGNLGAIARSADAAGADGVLVAEGEVDPWNPNAIRASTGSVFTLPIVEATREDVAALTQQKVAAVLGSPTRHFDMDLRTPTAFLIGAEDSGLDEEWRELADAQVEIPMSGATADSLNASAAAAVLLFEAVRQRDRGRGR